MVEREAARAGITVEELDRAVMAAAEELGQAAGQALVAPVVTAAATEVQAVLAVVRQAAGTALAAVVMVEAMEAAETATAASRTADSPATVE